MMDGLSFFADYRNWFKKQIFPGSIIVSTVVSGKGRRDYRSRHTVYTRVQVDSSISRIENFRHSNVSLDFPSTLIVFGWTLTTLQTKPLLTCSTVGKRAKGMPDTTVETTRINCIFRIFYTFEREWG